MPSLLLPRFALQNMSDKKSPPRKEKPFLVRTPQPDDKGMKRKLLSPPSPTHDGDDKKTPNKRKRGSLSCESSPMTNTKTPSSGSRGVPLSERQQLAMIMRMSDESSQEPGVKAPASPPLQPMKKTLVDKKVFKRNARGEMPIHLAAINGDFKMVKKLIKAGADVNVADFAGWTPLHEASNRGWYEITKQLLKAGANVNVQGLDDDTPLHDAAMNGHRKLVALLLKHGANPLQANAKGKTPLDVASNPEMVRILKKETICSASDSSSIDDVRSPMSPDSINSYKDDDKSIDLDDGHHNNRSESFSCSTSNRKISMPKSPDGKLASPRLCLKFHRDHYSHNSQKSRDSTYSVTNVSMSETLDNPMFSPVDSPASSIEGDLYHSHLDHMTNFSGSRVKITIPEDDSSNGGYEFKQNSTEVSDGGDRLVHPTNLFTKEVFLDQGVNNSNCEKSNTSNTSLIFPSLTCTSSDNQTSKSVLKSTETLPFKPNSQFSVSRNDDNALEELPDLEIDTSTSDSIPSKDVGSASHTNNESTPDCNSVSSSNINEAGQSLQNQSNVSSSTESSDKPTLTQVPEHQSVDTQIYSISSESISQVSSKSVSDSITLVSKPESQNTSEASPSISSVSCTNVSDNFLPSSSPNIEGESDIVKSDSARPCSPNQTDRESRDSRPSTPKVPPLKIIIPPKSQPSSTSDNNEGLKLVVTNVKSALPYVINPYHDQDNVEGMFETAHDNWSIESVVSSVSSVSNHAHLPSSALTNSVDLNYSSVYSDSSAVKVKRPESVKGESDKVEMEIDGETSAVDSGVKVAQDNGDKFSELNEDSNSSKCDSEGKRDEKKEEPTQRVLRSAVRSQQQSSTDSRPPKQPRIEKSDKADRNDKNNGADSTMSPADTPPAPTKPTKDDDDISIHPRKRKIKRTEQPTPNQPDASDSPEPVPDNNNTTKKDKVPNPYEIYLALRKKIASRRLGYLDMLSICPKTPQGFKDYLLKTCNYVLQGNNTSTLSVPTLSPPNSVKDKMRDLFIEQEEARYKLRLQHLIEREKLILSREQEILREHGRWERAIANHGTPLSVCTILRDEEIYNFTEDQVRLEEKDKKNRTRYNGRQFRSWIQDVDDKYEKIKELLILRQKQEADSLYAYQKLEWEWRLKELSLCDRNIKPDIDELHVPLVNVHDNFEFRTT